MELDQSDTHTQLMEWFVGFTKPQLTMLFDLFLRSYLNNIDGSPSSWAFHDIILRNSGIRQLFREWYRESEWEDTTHCYVYKYAIKELLDEEA